MNYDTSKPLAALFDLDGVIIDTENQYSVFWNGIGRTYLGRDDFGTAIKGSTLPHIYAAHFSRMSHVQNEITAALDAFEADMDMQFVAGFPEFFTQMKTAGWQAAIVTSSNAAKMASVYRRRPELRTWFSSIFTAEQFTRSKPAPDPYLFAAEKLGVPVQNCVVFEDSVNGLTSGKSAAMKVVALTTTNPAEAVALFADLIAPDFTALTEREVRRLVIR